MRASLRVSASSSGPGPRRSTSSPSSVAVRAMSSGLPRPLKIAGQRPRGFDRARHARRKQRAGVDRDDVMRAHAHEADLVRAAMGKARVKCRASPARAMRVDQRPDLRLDPGAPQRIDHEAALPFAIKRLGHMLRRAAATGSEPAAERFGPPGAGVENFDKFGAPPGELHPRALPGQDSGDGHAAVGDAVAARIESDDRQDLVSHGAPREGIPWRRRRREPARG